MGSPGVSALEPVGSQTMSKKLLAAAITVPLAALALTACSGGPHSAGSGTTSPSPSTTTAADVALARSELLGPSGFPSGWQSQGPGSENTSASFFGGMAQADVQAITTCLGISSAQVDTSPAEAADPRYSDPNSAAAVNDTVDVFPTVSTARFEVAATANPKLASCFVQLAPRFEGEAPKGVHFGTMSAHKAVIRHLGDEDAAMAASVPITYQGHSTTLYVEVVMVQKGRSESNLLFTGENAPPDPAVVDQVATGAADAMRTG